MSESKRSNDERKRYAEVAREVLEKFAGPQGARAILFYTGDPDKESFEENLRKVFGPGSVMILNEVFSRLGKSS